MARPRKIDDGFDGGKRVEVYLVGKFACQRCGSTMETDRVKGTVRCGNPKCDEHSVILRLPVLNLERV